MATMDEYFRDLEMMDGPGPSFGRPQTLDPMTNLPVDKMFGQMTDAEKMDVVEPLLNYHNAMNNVLMSGPVREGRSTIVTGKTEEDVYPYGTMFPTFPERPQTNQFDVNFYPGEANQINDFFRNQAGISQEQTQAVANAGGDPTMLPGFTLLPTPEQMMDINTARGLPAFPVLLNDMQNRGGLLDDVQMFYRSLFQ